MPIRMQLLMLVSALFLILGALAGAQWRSADLRLDDLEKMRIVEDVSSDAAEAVSAWVAERALIVVSLNEGYAYAEQYAARKEELRRFAGVRSARLMNAVAGARLAKFEPALREAEAALRHFNQLRVRVDAALPARSDEGKRELAEEWLVSSTGLAERFLSLRDDVARRLAPSEPRLIDAEVMRQAIYHIVEFSERERCLLAAAIFTSRQLSEFEHRELSEVAGHLRAAWQLLRARRSLYGYATRRAIDAAEEHFPYNFEDASSPMRLTRSAEAASGVLAERSRRSSAALEAVLAVQTAIRRENGETIAELTARAKGWVWVSGGLLLLAVALFVACLRTILIGVARDLAAQRSQIETIEKQERLSSLGALVAGVAHEINTPIGVAVTAASYLSDLTDKLDRDYRNQTANRASLEEYIETAAEGSSMILKNLERAASLISSFKRISVDQTSDQRRTFNLQQLIDDILVTLRPQLRQSSHRVSAECPPDLVLDGYPGLITQILTNLIMNSLVHAFPGTQAGRIDLTVAVRGGAVAFTYRDDGVGAPERVLDRMFEPFFTTKRGSGGSGLGLSIVHTLVTQKLGGEITASRAEPGLRFEIVLPQTLADGVVRSAGATAAGGRWMGGGVARLLNSYRGRLGLSNPSNLT